MSWGGCTGPKYGRRARLAPRVTPNPLVRWASGRAACSRRLMWASPRNASIPAVQEEFSEFFGARGRLRRRSMRHDDRVFIAHMVEFARKAHERVASRERDELDGDEDPQLQL